MTRELSHASLQHMARTSSCKRSAQNRALFALLAVLTIACRKVPQVSLMADPWSTHHSDPGTGSYNVGISPILWLYRFADGSSNALKDQQLRFTFKGFDRGEGWVRWNTNMRFNDNDAREPFNCYVQFAIMGLPHSFVQYGESPIAAETSGGPNARPLSVQAEGLKGFDAAAVVLTGWRFGYWNEDHNVERMGIRLSTLR